MWRLCCALLSLLTVCSLVEGHGFMLDPPARSTAWREGFKTPRNNDDNGLNCGGQWAQHDINGGKCGVCGDRYDWEKKENEPGPGNKYATGQIVANYSQGQIVEITVKLTAFHMGYLEFRLCENNIPQKGDDASIAVTQQCLDQNLLEAEGGQGKTRFPAIVDTSTHRVQLPSHIVCSACVLQWRYRAGNSWGCESGQCGLGYGPQEEFIGCADINISPSSGQSSDSPTGTRSTATTTRGTTEDKPDEDGEKPCWRRYSDANDNWCRDNCAVGNCPENLCKCDGDSLKHCRGVEPFGASHDSWCNQNCNHVPPNCPVTHCVCDE